MKKLLYFYLAPILLVLNSCNSKTQNTTKTNDTTTKFTTTVSLYFKDSDSTIGERYNFRTEPNNKGWIEFLTDFRHYFFSGVPQRLSRYQVQRSFNNAVENTQLNFRFTDIAFIDISTSLNLGPNEYTTTCPQNPSKLKDQHCILYFNRSGKSESMLASYSKGLSDMTLFFENRYLSSRPTGRYEYLMKTACEQLTHQVLMDWKFIRGIVLHKNNKG